MRKSLYLLLVSTFVAAMCATAAQAQTQINFADLPLVASPTPVPLGYHSLDWANMFYVDPSLYTSSGPGYQNLLTHRDVVFVGGRFCAPLGFSCYGVISVPGGPIDIQVVSAVMAAGYKDANVTFYAYRRGAFIGMMTTKLYTDPSIVRFPASWGAITELQISADSAGNVVLEDLSFYPLGG